MVDASASEVRQRMGNLQHLYFFVDQHGYYLVVDVAEEETADDEVWRDLRAGLPASAPTQR